LSVLLSQKFIITLFMSFLGMKQEAQQIYQFVKVSKT
jgi:hypothetical protein